MHLCISAGSLPDGADGGGVQGCLEVGAFEICACCNQYLTILEWTIDDLSFGPGGPLCDENQIGTVEGIVQVDEFQQI